MLIYYKKNAGISKVKGALQLKGIFFEATYVSALTYQISSFQHNSNEFQTGEIILSTTTKQTPKKPTQIRVKRLFFLKNRPIHFQSNSTRVIRPVKCNKFSFSNIEINNKPPPTLIYNVTQVRFEMPTLVVATNRMPDHTLSAVSSAQIAILQITRSSLMYHRNKNILTNDFHHHPFLC